MREAAPRPRRVVPRAMRDVARRGGRVVTYHAAVLMPSRRTVATVTSLPGGADPRALLDELARRSGW